MIFPNYSWNYLLFVVWKLISVKPASNLQVFNSEWPCPRRPVLPPQMPIFFFLLELSFYFPSSPTYAIKESLAEFFVWQFRYNVFQFSFALVAGHRGPRNVLSLPAVLGVTHNPRETAVFTISSVWLFQNVLDIAAACVFSKSSDLWFRTSNTWTNLFIA